MTDVRLPHTTEIRDDALRGNFEQAEQEFNTHAAGKYRNAVQKIPSAVFTALQLDTVLFDPDKCFLNNTYVCPRDGIYMVGGQVEIVMGSANHVLISSVFKNGGEAIRGMRLESVGAGSEMSTTVNGLIKCKRGDGLVLAVFQATGAEANLAATSSAKNYFFVHRVGQ